MLSTGGRGSCTRSSSSSTAPGWPIYNAMDENGLTDVTEIDLPVAIWCRVHIA